MATLTKADSSHVQRLNEWAARNVQMRQSELQGNELAEAAEMAARLRRAATVEGHHLFPQCQPLGQDIFGELVISLMITVAKGERNFYLALLDDDKGLYASQEVLVEVTQDQESNGRLVAGVAAATLIGVAGNGLL